MSDNGDWLSIFNYIRVDGRHDVAGIVIEFLFDLYGGMGGWKIKNYSEWSIVVRKKFDNGVCHSYSFNKSLHNYHWGSTIIPLELEDENDSVNESFWSPLSGGFRKFIIQNVDKLNPNYEDGDISELHWKRKGIE